MNKRKSVVALGLTGLLASGFAQAETALNFSGFGTLATTHSNSSVADYRGNIMQPNGAGVSTPWAFGIDTKAGAQVAANMGSGWSAVVSRA